MARSKTIYRCSECGWSTPKWVGQCRGCQAWSTMSEAGPEPTGRVAALSPATPARPISQIDGRITQRRATGIGELDRVLGGGFVPGAVILLTGEPGVGKSTLLLEVAARAAQDARQQNLPPVLYLTGEESVAQVRLRAERINALDDALFLANETEVCAVLGQVEQISPSLVIVDSVQTMTSSEVEGSAGGVAQVRAVAAALIGMAKSRNLPVILVGHVTKDGSIAGPRNLEHLVDVVCHFEGDRHARLRLLRSIKNRYGATDEVGCFEMSDFGIRAVDDPSGLFLTHTSSAVSGTCVTVTVEGKRPMPIQIQALVANSGGGSPRRTTAGVDHSRVAMTLAVLQARAGVDLSALDVYVSTVGGAKTTEPAVDLAVALALVSAASQRPPRKGVVAVGEVGLTGELRSTTAIARRLAEAARLGFDLALVPSQGWDPAATPAGMKVLTVDNISQAIQWGLAKPE